MSRLLNKIDKLTPITRLIVILVVPALIFGGIKISKTLHDSRLVGQTNSSKASEIKLQTTDYTPATSTSVSVAANNVPPSPVSRTAPVPAAKSQAEIDYEKFVFCMPIEKAVVDSEIVYLSQASDASKAIATNIHNSFDQYTNTYSFNNVAVVAEVNGALDNQYSIMQAKLEYNLKQGCSYAHIGKRIVFPPIDLGNPSDWWTQAINATSAYWN